jgi:DNA-binding MarR family transcriptional regulator
MNAERGAAHLADLAAGELRISVGLLVRRLRRTKGEHDDALSLPESLALSRLDREGASTGAELARSERITPQAMATTLRSLEDAGLIERSPDASDGRRVNLSVTPKGQATVQARRSTGNAAMAKRLATDFTADEIEHLRVAATLIERLARGL